MIDSEYIDKSGSAQVDVKMTGFVGSIIEPQSELVTESTFLDDELIEATVLQ